MLKIISFILIAVAGLLFYVRLFEKRTIFYPSKKIEVTPKDTGLEYDDIFFKAQDGIELHGWFIPAKNPYATVLYCHGNAGNISHRIEMAYMFNQKSFNFFIFDYRGFGKSLGNPDEKGTYLDAQAAYNYLVKTKKIAPQKIVIYGKSLGGVIAIDLATKLKAGALVSESSFISTKALAKDVYPFLPLWLFVSQRYDAYAKIDKADIPKLIIHSQNDEIVPFHHAEKLFTKAKAPKELYVMRGGHNDAFYIYRDECMQRIDNFLKKYLK